MRGRGGLRRTLRRVRGVGVRGWLALERDTLLQVAKTALAATLAWAVAGRVLGSELPAIAALGAIITAQVTVYQTLARASQYVVGVLAGVLVALALARLLGLHAWSVGLVVFGALLAGRALRLGTQANQVAISALLVVSLGTGYAVDRVLDALVGAALGVLVNSLVFPPTSVGAAGQALRRIAEDLAELCREVGARPRGSWGHAEARGWLQQAREIGAELHAAAEALDQAEESTRYNPRRGSGADTLPRYREALAALDHAVTQVRGFVRTLTDLTELGDADRDWRSRSGSVLSALGRLLRAAGDAARAFGALQTDGPERWEEHRRALREALTAASIARDDAGEALRAAQVPERAARLLASLIVDAERLLGELDPDAGAHAGALPAPAGVGS